jgi:hypothetical protein
MTTRRLFRAVSRHAPSPAMVVACVALIVALGGTSYAALRLPANSVGTAQLKKAAVTGVKVKRNTLTGVQIDERKLGPAPLALRSLSANRAPISRVDRVLNAGPIPTGGSVGRVSASCATGLTVIGGGARVSHANSSFIIDSYPLGTTGWEATAAAETAGATLTVSVICAEAAIATQ